MADEVKVGRLVVSRKKGERIMIGDNVVVEVVDLTNYRVRLMVVAPLTINVAREELLTRGGSTDGPVPKGA